MIQKTTAAAVLFFCALLSARAGADTALQADGVHHLSPVTEYGRRRALPSVVIELTRATAAHEAGAAHEEGVLDASIQVVGLRGRGLWTLPLSRFDSRRLH